MFCIFFINLFHLFIEGVEEISFIVIEGNWFWCEFHDFWRLPYSTKLTRYIN